MSMITLQLVGIGILGALVAVVLPLVAGLAVYSDAYDAGVPYPAPLGLSVAALFFAGLVPGAFGSLAYLSYRGEFSRR